MVRWRSCLVLAALLLLPARTGAEGEEDDDDERNEEDEEDADDDDEEEEQGGDKGDQDTGRRAPGILMESTRTIPITRTTKKRPLECYVCAYKSETPLRACLDPTKYRVHTMTCHSIDDRCFTSVISKGSSYEAVVRGCRSGCFGTPEITCCELNRCNHQAFALPTPDAPRALALESRATKSIPQSILFFITILLVLQTAAKVASA